MCQDIRTHRQMALNIAADIVHASRLGKSSVNASGRRSAYVVKARRLSTGLVKFPDYFKVAFAERDAHFGILLLVRLPNGIGAHVPMSWLSAEAQSLVHSSVVSLIEGNKYSVAA
jgi:hypothetical protein